MYSKDVIINVFLSEILQNSDSYIFSFSEQLYRPAHVAEWSAHSAAMRSSAWRAQWPRFAPQLGRVRLPKNYF